MRSAIGLAWILVVMTSVARTEEVPDFEDETVIGLRKASPVDPTAAAFALLKSNAKTDAASRVKAIRELALCGKSDARSEVLARCAVLDAAPEVRREALLTIKDAYDLYAAYTIAKLGLENDNHAVQRAAGEALREIDFPEVTSVLFRGFERVKARLEAPPEPTVSATGLGPPPSPVTTQTRVVTGTRVQLGGPGGRPILIPKLGTRVDDGFGTVGLQPEIGRSSSAAGTRSAVPLPLILQGISGCGAHGDWQSWLAKKERSRPVPAPNAADPPVAPVAPPIERAVPAISAAAAAPQAVNDASSVDSTKPRPVDLILLIDTSASMAAHWGQTERLVLRIVNRLIQTTPGLRVGWIPIGKIAPDADVHPLGDSRENLQQIFSVHPTGSSGNGANCLRAAVHNCIFRPEARRIVVLIGDDGTLKNPDDARAAARELHEKIHGGLYAIIDSRDPRYNEKVDSLCRAGGGELLGNGTKRTSAFDLELDWNAKLKP